MATRDRTAGGRDTTFRKQRQSVALERRQAALPVPAPSVAAAELPSRRGLAVKHIFDCTVAAAVILLVLPMLVVIALAVKVSSPGPVLYRQRRIGRGGRTFDILKFRTMSVAPPASTGFRPAEGEAPGGVEGTDRRSRVGRVLRRTSLDELPQLLNVLRGEMSLVGPRPERPEFVQLFADEVPGYADRHRMPVGITGLAQIRGLRGQTSIALRADADNEYIERWDLLLDLKVLLLTVRALTRAAE